MVGIKVDRDSSEEARFHTNMKVWEIYYIYWIFKKYCEGLVTFITSFHEDAKK